MGLMKLLKAEYVSFDGCFTKIKVKLDNGKEGFFLFENDGRDFEVEGDLDRQEIFDNQEALMHCDEAWQILKPELAKGTEAYELEGRKANDS